MSRNWIVCPVRNGVEMTVTAVQSFLNQDVGDISILLIDNSGHDAIWNAVWPMDDKNIWRVHGSPTNSVAASWNQGINHTLPFGSGKLILPWHMARDSSVLVCNNDIEIMPWTYRMLREDGGPLVTARGVVYREQMLDARPEPTAKWNHPDFSCFLLRLWAWRTVGPFDERFAMAYAEDNDWHVRCHIAGIEAVSLNIPHWHRVSATLKNCSPEEQARIHQQANANRAYFEAKWGFKIPPHDDGKYTEFFSKPRPDWKPFAANQWLGAA